MSFAYNNMNALSFSLKCSAERICKFLVSFSAGQNSSIPLSLTYPFSFYLISIGIFYSSKCYRCHCVVHETQVSYPGLCSANIWLYKLKLETPRTDARAWKNTSMILKSSWCISHLFTTNCKLPLRLPGIPLVPRTRYLHLMLENCVSRMACSYHFI